MNMAKKLLVCYYNLHVNKLLINSKYVYLNIKCNLYHRAQLTAPLLFMIT